MIWRAFGEAFVTLILIMDPISTAPIFLALTADQTPADRRRAAVQAAAAAGAVIVVFALFGRLILQFLHVSVQSLEIAGGLLLLLVALQMLLGESMAPQVGANVALVPLATPLLAGPGAIAGVLVLTGRFPDTAGQIAILLAILAVVVVIATTLLLAERIARFIRPSVMHLLTRVLGLLLAAIAVQFIIDAVRVVARG